MAAFELALRQGADALELDVRLSRDGVAIVLHDPTLDRTTKLRGAAAAYTAAQLRSALVPSLADVLAGFPRTPLLLDLKEAAVQLFVRELLLSHGAVDRCVLAGDERAVLSGFRGTAFATGACRFDVASLYGRAALRLSPRRVGYRLLSVPVHHRGLSVPTRWFVRAAKSLGCPVHVWTVDAPALARQLWARGVAGIVTNKPGLIRSARAGA